jgi:hypothetical protein
MRISVRDPSVYAPPPSEPSPIPSAVETGDGPSAFAQVLRGLGGEINRGEATMRTAMASVRSGGDLGAAQLIALQAGIYRYSEAIDLASRLVDRATSGVKTIVQGGGQ